ncbi:cryptochrome-1-like [Lineus longissimus]|uniref:cryptochrome-1-like n=1 Tax=Lineus longissimus TaxID=88925 RepID=UPI002B4E0E65
MAEDDMKPTSIYWFRKALRLHDNPALLEAVKNCREMRPIFILDPWFVKNAHVGINRWRFLMQCLENLDVSLKKINSRLFVIRGKPCDVFPKIFKEWGITKLAFETDTEPYAKTRDGEVEKIAREHGVEVIQRVSHTLYDVNRIIAKNGGKAPQTYQKLQSLLSQIGAPPKPVETLGIKHMKNCVTPVGNDHDDVYGTPTLGELGVNPDDLGDDLFPGGETEALARMDRELSRTGWVCAFEKPKTESNTLKPSTTVLSPYLKFGCLSARTKYYAVKEVYQKGKKHTSPPVSLEGQLLWREFYYTIASDTPNFDKMVGNPVCRQIPWEKNQEFLDAWKNARTGYPFIDAIMTQLRQEGWIHHLARHSVACFLTRGDLWVSWEEGQKIFEELLLDADWSLNAGNWMWLSASAFFHQYFRVYSPIAFGKKTDKNGDYIRKYIPLLSKFPTQYIYEPWKAPRVVQEKLGCVIGKDYPRPIVDHDEARQRNLKRMAAAFEANRSEDKKGGGSKRKQDILDTPPAKKAKKATTNKGSGKVNKKMTDFFQKSP